MSNTNNKARARFASFSDRDLIEWWRQYGCPHQAAFYRQAPRRPARAELVRRGLSYRRTISARPKGYGPDGDQYAPFWGLGGRIR